MTRRQHKYKNTRDEGPRACGSGPPASGTRIIFARVGLHCAACSKVHSKTKTKNIVQNVHCESGSFTYFSSILVILGTV